MVKKSFLAKAAAAFAAAAVLLTGCSGGQAPAQSGGDSSNGGSTGGAAGSDKEITVGFNNYSQGTYSLDILEKGFVASANAMGVKTKIVNDEGKLEKSTDNIDAMIASGVDGIVFFGVSDTLFPTLSKKCEEAKIPYAFFDHMPADDILADLATKPYYAGIAATVDQTTGKNFGEYALAQGKKNALIITGLANDTTHINRTNGFTDAFEAGGGKVKFVSHGQIELSQLHAQANDALTANPDVDVIYATNGDIGAVVVEELAKHAEVKADLYCTDLDPAVLAGLKNGTIAAANGAHWVNVDFATALLVNAIKGNKLTDASGKPVTLEVPVMTLPANMVDLYNKYWVDSHPFTDKELASWVADGVTADTLATELANYNITNRLRQLALQGIVSNDELTAVGIEPPADGGNGTPPEADAAQSALDAAMADPAASEALAAAQSQAESLAADPAAAQSLAESLAAQTAA